MRLQAHYSKAKSCSLRNYTRPPNCNSPHWGQKPLHSILKRRWEHLGLWRVSNSSNQNEQRMQVITSYQTPVLRVDISTAYTKNNIKYMRSMGLYPEKKLMWVSNTLIFDCIKYKCFTVFSDAKKKSFFQRYGLSPWVPEAPSVDQAGLRFTGTQWLSPK